MKRTSARDDSVRRNDSAVSWVQGFEAVAGLLRNVELLLCSDERRLFLRYRLTAISFFFWKSYRNQFWVPVKLPEKYRAGLLALKRLAACDPRSVRESRISLSGVYELTCMELDRLLPINDLTE